MKICWDNLEKLRYKKKGYWKYKNNNYKIFEKCKYCKEPFLGISCRNPLYCSTECQRKSQKNQKRSEETKEKMSESHKGNKLSEETKEKISKANKGVIRTEEWSRKQSISHKGKKLSEETKRKISEAHKGKKLSEETKRKMSKARSGDKHHMWKGGVCKLNIPFYDTYAPQIYWCEEVRRNKENRNILEVKCSYCGKWYIPTKNAIQNRIAALKGLYQRGESKLYCSDHCKECCPVYRKTAETLMKEDAVRAGRDPWWKMVREAQPELRQMVFKRDGYKCIKCGSTKSLHCHHIEGILWEPLQSADMDMCITVCKDCHEEIHKKEGCGYNDMKCK